MKTQELQEKAKNIRRGIVEMIYRAQSSHIGCALSSTDILTALYFDVMNVDPENPGATGKDHFVMSKGHGVTALYTTLGERGFFSKGKLEEYGKDGTELASHVVRGAVPGAETSSGSGGHGLSLGIGIALAEKKKKSDSRVFVLSGDGELQEGSVWEAVLFSGFHKLANLTMIVDRNDFQDGKDGLRVSEILNLDPLDEKFRSFGWEVSVVDGHNFGELIPALKKSFDKPHVIIANTIKGKGVSFMEGDGKWHGSSPSEEEYKTAIKELK